jgi:two-component system, chemotaxis family, chemotaxis protein CheY
MQTGDISILVVDDVNTMRVQIGELLGQSGFSKIKMAGSGEEAIHALDTGADFHLVLADWSMAPVDGLELLFYVRHHPKYKNIAFAMLTAQNTKEKVMEALTAGIDDYLMKPLTQGQVQDRVIKLLKKKKVIE